MKTFSSYGSMVTMGRLGGILGFSFKTVSFASSVEPRKGAGPAKHTSPNHGYDVEQINAFVRKTYRRRNQRCNIILGFARNPKTITV